MISLGHLQPSSTKCQGLPLAIVAVARAMADRDGVGDWADALREMEKSAADLRGMKDEVFVPLQFSFDRLKDDMLRSLFLYCACFPEDSNIHEDDILDFCVGEGLVDELGSLRAVRNRGEAMIKSLKIASMLEDGEFEGSVRMHDMMRELALMITSSGSNDNPHLLTRTGGSFEKAPHANEWLEATWISLLHTQIKTLPELGEGCPKLTTLLLRENRILAVVPELNFFQRMDHLHVLDLSFSSSLEYLPESLSHLVNLRVLSLRSCPKLRALPELRMLRQLQVLDLKYCYMIDQQIFGSKCFDSSSKSLDLSINLRYLDVSYTKVFIPAGVISHHLLKLEGLHLRSTTNIKWAQRGEGNNEERSSGLCSSDEGHHRPSIIDVGELSRLTHLSSLQICLEDITISDWFKPLANKITGMELQSCTFIKQDAIKPLYESEHLQWLTISKCRGLTYVTFCAKYGLTISDCEDLEKVLDGAEVKGASSLILRSLPKLEGICVGPAPLNFLGHVSNLRIHGCNRLKMVFTKGSFNNLRIFQVQNCYGMEVIIEAEEENQGLEGSNKNGVISPFPNLRRLTLRNLEALTDVCSNHILHCPHIEYVMVDKCPRLKKDPLHIHNADGLLVMEDESTEWKGNVVEEEIQMI